MLPRLWFFNITMVNMTVYACRVMSSICRLIVLSVFLSGSIAAWAYEETSVLNGGTVTGTVQFSGELPPPMPFALHRYPDPVYCGALSDVDSVVHLLKIYIHYNIERRHCRFLTSFGRCPFSWAYIRTTSSRVSCWS